MLARPPQRTLRQQPTYPSSSGRATPDGGTTEALRDDLSPISAQLLPPSSRRTQLKTTTTAFLVFLFRFHIILRCLGERAADFLSQLGGCSLSQRSARAVESAGVNKIKGKSPKICEKRQKIQNKSKNPKMRENKPTVFFAPISGANSYFFLKLTFLSVMSVPIAELGAHLASAQTASNATHSLCILAHVDHGKTTLADTLIASNGGLSRASAGRVRLLDLRPDEQERRITMKSAAITLVHDVLTPTDKERHLIHLLDTPGHVDFASEVSTAVRLCDGALLVVDCVEGPRVQTRNVLRQAREERVTPILVLNKIDRLFFELGLTPEEAYEHLRRVVEQVNALAASIHSVVPWLVAGQSAKEGGEDDNTDDEEELFTPEANNVVFAAAYDRWGFRLSTFAKIWGQRLGVPAERYAMLQKAFWGPFRFDPKAKRITKLDPKVASHKPMFVQFIVEPLWQIFEAARDEETPEKLKGLAQKLGVVGNMSLRELNFTGEVSADHVHQSRIVAAGAVLSAWLPISPAVLDAVCELIPTPAFAAPLRVPSLFDLDVAVVATQRPEGVSEGDSPPHDESRLLALVESRQQKIFSEMKGCSAESPDVVACVSKVFSVGRDFSLPEDRRMTVSMPRRYTPRPGEAAATVGGGDEVVSTGDETTSSLAASAASHKSGSKMVGILRVFSGTLRLGMKIFVLAPRFRASEATVGVARAMAESADKDFAEGDISDRDVDAFASDMGEDQQEELHFGTMEVTELFLLMGRALEPVSEVPAGAVCGIGGDIAEHVHKSATLSSSLSCGSFHRLVAAGIPLVRVAVEPTDPTQVQQVAAALRLLQHSDPAVRSLIQPSGELVVASAGELHLERCLRDLRELFLPPDVQLKVSKPLVAFEETIVPLDPALQADVFDTGQAKSAREILSQKTNWFFLGDSAAETSAVVRTSNKLAAIRVRAVPIPDAIQTALRSYVSELRKVFIEEKCSLAEVQVLAPTESPTNEERVSLKEALEEIFGKCGEPWASLVSRLWSAGPRSVGGSSGSGSPCCLLFGVDPTEDCSSSPEDIEQVFHGTSDAAGAGTGGGDATYDSDSDEDSAEDSFDDGTHEEPTADTRWGGYRRLEGEDGEASDSSGASQGLDLAENRREGALDESLGDSTEMTLISMMEGPQRVRWLTYLRRSIVNGFQLATAAGPLCAEPMSAVAFVLEDVLLRRPRAMVEFDGIEAGVPPPAERRLFDTIGPFGGQVITACREACRASMVASSALRLVEALYLCEVAVPLDCLGNVYNVLNKRRAKVLGETVAPGSTSVFVIRALLPVAESFGMYTELLDETHGAASAQLVFDRWLPLDEDPFWQAMTEDELEDHGASAEGFAPNLARTYMDDVRRRKGLAVEEKIVEHAEKQRTLKRNK
jgi:ribosome assembly protein 1